MLTGACVTSPTPSGDPLRREVAGPRCTLRTWSAPVPPGGTATGELRTVRDALPGFSAAATETADTIGALEPLRRFVALEAEISEGTSRGAGAALQRLQLRQAITDRILLATLDVSSSLAEVTCEGQRGNELRDRLQRIEDRRAQRLTLATIMVGALTAVTSGGLSLAGAAGGDLAGIIGGTAEAGVATTLVFGGASGELRTERNLLRDVWERPERSSLFPATLWRFLTRPHGSEPSIAERLRADWQAGERLGPAGSREERDRIDLLFGPGGPYIVEDLELRDATIDLLRASISLMSQDLRGLLEEVLQRTSEAEAPRDSHRNATRHGRR